MCLTVAVGHIEQIIIKNPTDNIKIHEILITNPNFPDSSCFCCFPFDLYNSGMSANRLRSPCLLAIGTFKRVVNVNTLDAGDCSPLLGAEMLLREVDGV